MATLYRAVIALACLPTELYCGPAVSMGEHTESRRADSHSPNAGSKGGLVFSFLSQCSRGSCCLRALIPAPVTVVALGKPFLTSETHICFVKWRQQCVYMFILCVYFPWRRRFVLTQRLRWLPKYNINKSKVCALDFLSYLQKSEIWNIIRTKSCTSKTMEWNFKKGKNTDF